MSKFQITWDLFWFKAAKFCSDRISHAGKAHIHMAMLKVKALSEHDPSRINFH